MSQPTVKNDPKIVQAEIERLSRKPFARALQTFLDNAPTEEAIHAAANKQPDRWTQSLAMLGKLTGYSEKTEHTENINVNIYNMSDVQLQSRLNEVMAKLSEVNKSTNTLPLTKIEKPEQPDVYAIDSDHAMKDKAVPEVQGLPAHDQDDPP